jgi:hypothetical protein
VHHQHERRGAAAKADDDEQAKGDLDDRGHRTEGRRLKISRRRDAGVSGSQPSFDAPSTAQAPPPISRKSVSQMLAATGTRRPFRKAKCTSPAWHESKRSHEC